jgi:hypothetical protein
MAETLSSCIAVPFTFSGTQTVTVTDSGTGSPRTFAMDSGTYRTFLAQTGTGTPGLNSGTEADPRETIALLEHYLNDGAGGTLWSAVMTADGFVKITNIAAGPGAEIDFTSADGLAAALGFHPSGFSLHVDLIINNGASHTADYPPMFFGATISRPNDTGESPLPQAFASSTTADGQVIGWGDNTRVVTRKWDARFHPNTWSDRTTLSAAGTVMKPTTLAQAQSPSRVADGDFTKLPWSFQETIQCAAAVKIAVAHANFQELVAGSDHTFDVCYLDADTINAQRPVRLTSPNNGARRDYVGIGLNKYADGER